MIIQIDNKHEVCFVFYWIPLSFMVKRKHTLNFTVFVGAGHYSKINNQVQIM